MFPHTCVAEIQSRNMHAAETFAETLTNYAPEVARRDKIPLRRAILRTTSELLGSSILMSAILKASKLDAEAIVHSISRTLPSHSSRITPAKLEAALAATELESKWQAYREAKGGLRKRFSTARHSFMHRIESLSTDGDIAPDLLAREYWRSELSASEQAFSMSGEQAVDVGNAYGRPDNRYEIFTDDGFDLLLRFQGTTPKIPTNLAESGYLATEELQPYRKVILNEALTEYRLVRDRLFSQVAFSHWPAEIGNSTLDRDEQRQIMRVDNGLFRKGLKPIHCAGVTGSQELADYMATRFTPVYDPE